MDAKRERMEKMGMRAIVALPRDKSLVTHAEAFHATQAVIAALEESGDLPGPDSEPCGATVVLGRYEGHAQITRWCERRGGPCPWGPRADIYQGETCAALASEDRPGGES